jgi:hypothetical protein
VAVTQKHEQRCLFNGKKDYTGKLASMDYEKVIDHISRLIDSHDYVLLLSDRSRESILIENAFRTRITGQNVKVINCDNDDLDLCSLFSLYEFTDKLIFGSFDFPPERKLRNLLDSGVATEEELINEVILGSFNGKSC